MKRLRKRVEVEPRVYDAIRRYAEKKAMSVSGAFHDLVVGALEQKGITLPAQVGPVDEEK